MGCFNDKHAGAGERADGSLHSGAAGSQPPGQTAPPTAQGAALRWPTMATLGQRATGRSGPRQACRPPISKLASGPLAFRMTAFGPRWADQLRVDEPRKADEIAAVGKSAALCHSGHRQRR